MRIVTTRRRARPETLYVFELQDTKELGYILDALKEKDVSQELLDKIQSRCDDKYAHDDTVASFFLFEDEMALFAESLMIATIPNLEYRPKPVSSAVVTEPHQINLDEICKYMETHRNLFDDDEE